MAYITFQPNDHFNTKLYTGNGSTQNITGVGHQVDWTWIKYRTDTEGHGLFDVLRGALYRLQSNSNSASSSQSGTVTSFGSDGDCFRAAAGLPAPGSPSSRFFDHE